MNSKSHYYLKTNIHIFLISPLCVLHECVLQIIGAFPALLNCQIQSQIVSEFHVTGVMYIIVLLYYKSLVKLSILCISLEAITFLPRIVMLELHYD